MRDIEQPGTTNYVMRVSRVNIVSAWRSFQKDYSLTNYNKRREKKEHIKILLLVALVTLILCVIYCCDGEKNEGNSRMKRP